MVGVYTPILILSTFFPSQSKFWPWVNVEGMPPYSHCFVLSFPKSNVPVCNELEKCGYNCYMEMAE